MDDVLKAELIWIEGRCYRVNESTDDLGTFQEQDMYDNETMHHGVDDDDDLSFEVSVLDNGRYCSQFHVAHHYLGAVIGKKAIIKRKIESDTRTEIKIPKPGQDGDVVVLGPSAASVRAARRRINMVVMGTRFKQSPTHFISIPLNSATIITNFNQFKEEILREGSDRGLDESMFTGSAKLHLTLCVLYLADDEERRLASKLLTEVRDTILIPALRAGPLVATVSGVAYMNDNPREVRVLYAPVKDADGRLQALADDVANHFVSGGYSQWEHGRRGVKLHMTLVNARYGKDEDDDEGPSEPRSRFRNFDASRILERYARHEFGEREVTELHLSQMHAYGPDGYYKPTCVVSADNADSPNVKY